MIRFPFKRGTRLLVATRHSPLPTNDGAGAYLFDILSYLAARGVRIEVAWFSHEGEWVRRGWWKVPRSINRVYRLEMGSVLSIGRWRFFRWGSFKANLFHRIKLVLMILGWRPARVRLAINPAPAAPAPSAPAPVLSEEEASRALWSSFPSAAETKFFRQRVRRFRPDAILANYCWLTPLLESCPDLASFVLTHDVASQRLGSSNGRQVPDPGTPEGETQLLKPADYVLAISEDDAAVFRQFLPGKSVILVPKAARPNRLRRPPVEMRCLFVGGMNHHNREGLEWFLREIWPAVRQACPEAILHVCGAIGEVVTAPPEGVEVLGRIEDLSAEYAQASVVIVPLLNGSGVKIKLVEACSYGKACVTTSVGLQGLSFFRNAVELADDPQTFAAGVIRLLGDQALRTRLGEASLEAVQAHLSPHASYEPLCRELHAAR